MRVALSVLLSIPVAAAGAVALFALPTGSPASDALNLGPQFGSQAASQAGPAVAMPLPVQRTFAPQHSLSVAGSVAGSGAGQAASSAGLRSSRAGSTNTGSTNIVLAQATSATTASSGAALVTGTIPAARTVAPPTGSAGAPQQSVRTDLARSLQKELKRVGCYTGEANGEWSAATQQGMNAFLQRLNASLPTAEPDFILLTLVQGQTTTACSATVAQPKTQPAAPQMVQGTTVPGAAKGPEVGTGWRTAVTTPRTPANAVPPQVQQAAPEARTAATVVAPAAFENAARGTVAPPLAGRMAIGGPAGAAPVEALEGGQQSPPVTKLTSEEDKTNRPKPTPRRTETRERTASAPAPQSRRDTNWTKNFFER